LSQDTVQSLRVQALTREGNDGPSCIVVLLGKSSPGNSLGVAAEAEVGLTTVRGEGEGEASLGRSLSSCWSFFPNTSAGNPEQQTPYCGWL
jgi:hypothetical protein